VLRSLRLKNDHPERAAVPNIGLRSSVRFMCWLQQPGFGTADLSCDSPPLYCVLVGLSIYNSWKV
jgi:hypothetical protein